MSDNLTPMMQQYTEIKDQHKEYLLLFRLGDFYEFFFEDATEAARALDIALTRRGEVPMCGIPFHSADSYIQKLVKQGFKLAICEQLESPEEAKKRGAKSVVKREVTRIITPGTVMDDMILEARSLNFLAAINEHKGFWCLCLTEISTGIFDVISGDFEKITQILKTYTPKEILLPDRLFDLREMRGLVSELKILPTTQVGSYFDAKRGERNIYGFYNINNLDALGKFTPLEIGSVGAVIEYVRVTQKGGTLPFPRKIEDNLYLTVDSSTAQNLELLKGNFDASSSLIKKIDLTESSIGARKFFEIFTKPLLDINLINERFDIIEYFINNGSLSHSIRDILKIMPDFERSLGRLTFKRAGPRDLYAIGRGLLASENLGQIFASTDFSQMPPKLQKLSVKLGKLEELGLMLDRVIDEGAKLHARDGGFIKPGFDPRLDELFALNSSMGEAIEKIRDKYRAQTGVAGLKIAFNNIYGYYIEVTQNHAEKLLKDTNFIHRQSLAGSVRFVTTELKELEDKIITSKDKILRLELEIFESLCQEVLEHAEAIKETAYLVGMVDIFVALARLALEHNYVRPILEDSNNLEIRGGRHPVIEGELRKQGKSFVGNNLDLSNINQVSLISGPNMGGKSTYLRQNALIVYLAQLGSFVPASFARIGIVDRIFCRVGASDNLAKNQSTFMVEMVETATILNQATKNSLIVLDEIGRGTATFDGVAIAYSVLEHIHNKIGARTIFATHYHELMQFAEKLQKLNFFTVKVLEEGSKIIFMYEVVPGKAKGSYGIHVASLAGFPRVVLRRAEEILNQLDHMKYGAINTVQPSLFTAAKEVNEYNEVLDYLKNLEPEELSPKEALEILFKLKLDAIA